MKAVITYAMIAIAALSLGACVGKGKGKTPAPIVTRG